ncbi:hypothetical protein CAPTEDRAFT_212982 [Capitella teleta]|uniref:Uncharacterized protein n=1 Tax=Capitella teleta TaxID=283909 RepID=R7UA25_CAPTE|nr:hypothetical protein CAPTEDRAFT_212982 [Capitella teleta]|eukprot:ELU02834.1 hypothetical protein CAPTEDRAFT_212982 [Capitella teleta]
MPSDDTAVRKDLHEMLLKHRRWIRRLELLYRRRYHTQMKVKELEHRLRDHEFPIRDPEARAQTTVEIAKLKERVRRQCKEADLLAKVSSRALRILRDTGYYEEMHCPYED